MKSRTKIVALVAGLALFVAAFAWLLTTHGPLAPVRVQLGSAVRTGISPTVFGIGAVDARLSYAVGPIAPGRVLRVLVDQGDTVKTGQLLAEMDPLDLDRRIQAARSGTARSRQAMQAAEAQVAEAASRARLALTNRDRDRALFEGNAISKRAFEQSAGEAERAEAALAAARANAAALAQDIGRVDAEAGSLGRLRESLRLVSPVDGVVVARQAEPGTTVVAGQSVLRIVVPESLWVRARVDQSRAQGVQIGQPASIVLRSSPNTPLPGRVARIELQSDTVTEERLVSVSFDAPPEHLYLGELAEVTIRLPTETGVLVVPSAAISRTGSQIGVWQMVDGRARFKPVAVGSPSPPEATRILSGLDEGEPVIAYSSAELKAGARVRERKVERR